MRFAPSALRLHARALALLAAALLAAACDDDHHHDDPHDGGGHGDHQHFDGGCGSLANCEGATVELEPGLRVESEDGLFTVEVVSVDDLSVLDSAYTVTIEDQDGNAVEDAELTVDVFSLDCMHGGPDDPADVSAGDQGRYELHPVHAHGGPWATVIEIEAGGERDTARIPLCVPGDAH